MTDTTTSNHSLRIFLCHASGDKPAVRELYHRLLADGFAPWLDEEDLLPGQTWRNEIPKAVRASDVVLVCLSQQSVNKTGYVQKEIKFALDVADEQPEGTIFLIPLRLEECEVPDRLRHLQWVNLFDEGGYANLLRSLRQRANSLGLNTPATTSNSLSTSQPPVRRESTAPVTKDGRASLQRQLNDLRSNLTLIEERKAEYVLATDIPLQLVKDERRLKEQIAEVEQRLSAYPSATSDQHLSVRDPFGKESEFQIIDVAAIIDYQAAELERYLGQPTSKVARGIGSSQELPSGGETRQYRVGAYLFSINYDKADIAQGIQILEGLSDHQYALDQWPLILSRLMMTVHVQPDTVAPAAVHWKNYAGYAISLMAEKPNGIVWSVRIYRNLS